MIKEVRHVGITVTDIEKSLKFYKDFLGFEENRIMNESGKHIDNMLSLENVNVKTVKLSLHNTITLVELLEFRSHPKKAEENLSITRIGTSHFALTVENLDQIYQDWKKRGIEFNSEPQISPDGYAKVVFCHDPDRNSIELVEVLNEDVLNTKNMV